MTTKIQHDPPIAAPIMISVVFTSSDMACSSFQLTHSLDHCSDFEERFLKLGHKSRAENQNWFMVSRFFQEGILPVITMSLSNLIRNVPLIG